MDYKQMNNEIKSIRNVIPATGAGDDMVNKAGS
jgi:hypothetical protein